MKQTVVYSVFALMIFAVSGCTSHHFINKTGQTDQQFIQDKAYCQGLATGQQSLNNTEGERLISYDECMRKLGYLPK